MRKLYLLIVSILSFSSVGYSQLIKRGDDVSEKDFGIHNFKNLDADFAMELLNQQAKTIITSLANKAAAAVPLGGTAGVAMEVGVSNLKLDELIVANKNYNYKLTGVLGNILKITKETRDGTMASRAKYAARKVEIVDESLRAIKKCQKTREALTALGEKGWTTTNMLRAVNAIDGTLFALEKIGQNLLQTTNSIAEESRLLDNSEKELKDLNEQLDKMYASALQELDEKIASQYQFEYNSALLNGAMYFQGLTQEEGQEKYEKNISRSKDGLTAFKNIMWLFVVIFFLAAATANIWKVYFMGDDSMAFIRYSKAWIAGFAVSILMAGILERVLPIIYS